MPFIENAWYVAALSTELPASTPLGRRLLDRPLVMFRDGRGAVAVLDDRCPHRFAPLSAGQVTDGVLACAYHGLRFAADGRCVHNPHGDGRIPPGACVRAYPSLERYGAIWFWPGDPARADAARLPEWSFLDPSTSITGHGYLETQASYLLSAENLLDLSHFQFLHPLTLGSTAMAGADVRIRHEEGDHVVVEREIHREKLQPFVADAFGIPRAALVTRRLDVHWQPPALLTIDVSITTDGAAPGQARIGRSAHWLTPRTESSAHYFFAFGLPRALGKLAEQMVRYAIDGLMLPFEREDLPMLAAQQRAIGDADFWSLNPVSLAMDAGAVRARRIVERLLREERAQDDDRADAPAARVIGIHRS
jgi:phenylpropionate dioxygenase-like ring-hydroxylating dioxygenase large terminal subunit